MTVREKIVAHLNKIRPDYASVSDLYRAAEAETVNQKTTVRLLLGKYLGTQFIRDRKRKGYYRIKENK